eukprot:TRINITY_DN4662_c0_g1_i1.p1 TRINITY_DN4662_c0_g1~~TRINITY_DN4662_c0_g1_i1.p1  ORF type:complete len:557 (+),score=158.09 TRINITY_DN4662_c0_g1_i1:86-1672(+)
MTRPETGEQPLRGDWYGYVALAAGFAVHICLGTCYTWGNLTTYVTSYMRGDHPDLVYADTLWPYFVAPFTQALTMFFGGHLQYRFGARLTCILGCVLFGLSVFSAGLATKNGSLAGLILGYGALSGLGMGTAYTTPINTALRYLPHRRGMINGVVVGGFGLGAFVFNFFITAYANPHNCKPVCPDGGRYTGFVCPGWNATGTHDWVGNSSGPSLGSDKCPNGDEKYFPPDSDVAGTVPALFVILGVVYCAIMLPASLFLVRPGQPFFPGCGAAPAAVDESDADSDPGGKDVEGVVTLLGSQAHSNAQSEAVSYVSQKAEEAALEAGADVSTREALHRSELWQLLFGFLLTGMGGLLVVATYKSFGQDQSWSSDHFEQQVSSYMSVANAAGRLVAGQLADACGFTRVLCVLAILQTAVLGTFALAGGAEQWTFVIWCCLCAFLYGSNFALYPTGTCVLFGPGHFPTNYGFVFLGFGVGSLLISVLNKSLVDRIHFGGMTALGAVLCGAGAANAILLYCKAGAGRRTRPH